MICGPSLATSAMQSSPSYASLCWTPGKTQGQFVEISDVKEYPDCPLRLTGRFTHKLRGGISTGIVWYDVSSSTTGPDDVSPVVRNEMRFAVLRKLTGEGTVARALVDLHK